MSAPTSLKLRVSELEWSSQAALGLLPGQMERDELEEVLLTSATLQAREGGREATRRFLARAPRRVLERLYAELEGDDHLRSPASGRLRGLGWVDSTISRRERPFQMIPAEDGTGRYRHIPYGFFLPSVLTNAAISAQKRGEPTVLEGYLLLFAWVEWLIASRYLLWSPTTPKPDLLAVLVEAFGIGPELHRENPERLMRLAARLPSWYPSRGTVARAYQILVETLGETLDVALLDIDAPEAERAAAPLTQEVLSCRSAEWWQQRQQQRAGHVIAGDQAPMRVSDGLLRFQSAPGEDFSLVREDVLVGWKVDTPFPAVLSRVLPIWVSIRIVALSG